MNVASESASPVLLDIIQFKWLMSRLGRHVHVERLQSDRGYALTCLAEAEQCGDAALMASACKLALRLGA